MQFTDVQNEPFYILFIPFDESVVCIFKSQDIEYEIHWFDCRLPICQFECVCSVRLHGNFSTPALCVVFICVCHYLSTLKCHLPVMRLLYCLHLHSICILQALREQYGPVKIRPRKQLVPQTKTIVTKCLSLQFYSGNVPLVPTSEQQHMSPFINMDELRCLAPFKKYE